MSFGSGRDGSVREDGRRESAGLIGFPEAVDEVVIVEREDMVEEL